MYRSVSKGKVAMQQYMDLDLDPQILGYKDYLPTAVRRVLYNLEPSNTALYKRSKRTRGGEKIPQPYLQYTIILNLG